MPLVEEEMVENQESYVLTYSQKPVENLDENDESFKAFEECSQVRRWLWVIFYTFMRKSVL